MARISLKERKHTDFVIPKNDGKKVCLAGFVKTIRRLGKNLVFIILQDIQGEVQLTFTKENFSANELEKISSLHLQSVLVIEGYVHKSKLVKKGIEVIVNKYEVLSESHPNLPLDLVQLTSKLNKRLDYRWLDLRIKKHQIIFKILSDFVKLSREYFYKNRFIEIFTPKLMGAPSESGAELFTLPYFGKEA
jgi:aspartyl-tRNA synthetase